MVLKSFFEWSGGYGLPNTAHWVNSTRACAHMELDYRAGGVMVPADRELLTFLRYAERQPRARQADLIASVRS